MINKRNGMGLIWAMTFVLAMCVIASLAIDYGRVQLVKMQLHSAADAAALAAGDVLATDPSSARSTAVQIAAANNADGAPVALDANNDVEFGTWNSTARQFTAVSNANISSANAVRVTAHRNAARGTAVPLSFGKLIGMDTCDVNASAIASASIQGYSIVGLNYVTLSGGAVTGFTTAEASVASNGDISMSGGATINGDAHPGVGHTWKHSGGSKVTGSTTPLTQPLVYPNANASGVVYNNNDNMVPSSAMKGQDFSTSGSQVVTLPPGTYYFTNFNMSGGSKLILNGPTVIYCCGKFTISGGVVNNYGPNPQDFQIFMAPTPSGVAPGKVDISGGSGLYANVYAPQSDINISGSGHLYGSVVGLSVTQSGSATIHGAAAPATSGVALVK